MSKTKTEEVSVEERLKALYELQLIDSKIDKIKTVRGELPLEVRDLEDMVEGLETRIEKFNTELQAFEDSITEKKNVIKDSSALIKKYTTQQGKVRNNREHDSLTKEIEFQNLEIELAEKRIKEYKANIISKKAIAEVSEQELVDRKKDLKIKKKELAEIVEETEKEETSLNKKSKLAEAIIDDRLLSAYKRIRKNVMNGMGVVTVERDACGGCFNRIPPQRHLDIKTHKKIIVCEHCGRILVDADILTGKPQTAKA
jgi:uncharacterized protein